MRLNKTAAGAVGGVFFLLAMGGAGVWAVADATSSPSSPAPTQTVQPADVQSSDTTAPVVTDTPTVAPADLPTSTLTVAPATPAPTTTQENAPVNNDAPVTDPVQPSDEAPATEPATAAAPTQMAPDDPGRVNGRNPNGPPGNPGPSGGVGYYPYASPSASASS